MIFFLLKKIFIFAEGCTIFQLMARPLLIANLKNPTTPLNGLTMKTIRQEIIELLNDDEMDARELSRAVGIKEKEVYEHLTHIARSVAAMGSELTIRPSECLKCGFVFNDRKRFTRPGRCPRCRESHIINPSFRITKSG